MQRPQKGKACFAQRAGLLMWLATQVVWANNLPEQQEARYRVWKLAAEAGSVTGQARAAADPAASLEATGPALGGGAARAEQPVELWPDVRPNLYRFPPDKRGGPPRSVQMAVWTLLTTVATVLATTDTRHHRRRTHTGHRHARAPAPE